MRFILYQTLFFICVIHALAWPVNSFRGHGLYWKNEFSDGRLLSELSDLGYNKLFYRTAKLDINSLGRLEKEGVSWNLEEQEWEKKLSFTHYLEFQLTDNFVEKFQQRPALLNYSFSSLLQQELDFYQGRFAGVVLSLSPKASELLPDFGELRDLLAAENYLLGIKLPAASIPVAAKKWTKQPDFLLLSLEIGDEENIADWNRWAVRLNIPFQYVFSMQEQVSYGAGYVLDSGESRLLFREAELQEISEKSENGVICLTYALQKPYHLHGNTLSVGELIKKKRRNLQLLFDFIKTNVAISHFWYSGMVVNLASVSARILLKQTIELSEPLLYYSIKEEGTRFVLQLSMENPNPVRSEGIDKTGIGVYVKGFRLKSLELADFIDLKADSDQQAHYFFFTRHELAAFSRTEKLALELEKIAPQSEIGAVSWLKPEFSAEVKYFPAASPARLPEYNLRNSARILWRNN